METACPGKPPFEAVYERYYSRLLFYVLRRVDSREDAEDLVQATLCYCYLHYGSFDPAKSALNTWIYLILNSRIKNYFRDRKESEDISELDEVLGGREDETERAVWLQQRRDHLHAALMSLPEQQRRAVILRYFHDKSSAEIGLALGVSAGNARVILSRALDRLGELCKDWQ